VRVLVIGQGAREHAIVRSLKQDPAVTKIFAAPANAGIAKDAQVLNFSMLDIEQAAIAAREHNIDLVVIGPEVALAAGMADKFNELNIACFGPTQAATKIESSKAFAKEVMQKKNIPTARSFYCAEISEVIAAIENFGPPYVIKDDQLAAGKGVVVTTNKDEAITHAKECLAKSDGKVVVEEFLSGKEVSILFISDGETIIALEPAQDYKRAFDNDEGPNTGGMGAYSPIPWIDQELINNVKENIAQPVINYLKEINTPFVGVLYAGLILTNDGPKVIEFNARFGDPETQVILARLKTPITELFLNAVNKN
jgi:phosphoribosylamine---glycine ligase